MMAECEKKYSEEEFQAEQKRLLQFTGLVFYHIAKEVVDRFGEAGKEAIERAMTNCGEERGRSIRERVLSLGLEPTLPNMQKYYDLPTSTVVKSKREITPDKIISTIYYCPLAEVWMKKGRPDLGVLWCSVDPAVRRGYDPKVKFKTEKNMMQDSETCVHITYLDDGGEK